MHLPLKKLTWNLGGVCSPRGLGTLFWCACLPCSLFHLIIFEGLWEYTEGWLLNYHSSFNKINFFYPWSSVWGACLPRSVAWENGRRMALLRGHMIFTRLASLASLLPSFYLSFFIRVYFLISDHFSELMWRLGIFVPMCVCILVSFFIFQFL